MEKRMKKGLPVDLHIYGNGKFITQIKSFFFDGGAKICNDVDNFEEEWQRVKEYDTLTIELYVDGDKISEFEGFCDGKDLCIYGDDGEVTPLISYIPCADTIPVEKRFIVCDDSNKLKVLDLNQIDRANVRLKKVQVSIMYNGIELTATDGYIGVSDKVFCAMDADMDSCFDADEFGNCESLTIGFVDWETSNVVEFKGFIKDNKLYMYNYDGDCADAVELLAINVVDTPPAESITCRSIESKNGNRYCIFEK